MSVIGSLEKAWTYVSGDSKPAATPASAPAAPTQATVPASALAAQTGTASAPSASSNVTNAQGHTARMALGATGSGPGRTDDIPPPPPMQLDWSYDSSLTTNGPTPLSPGTPASRLEDLRGVSQLDSNKKTTNDGQRCGASSIVAGAYYAGGTDGVKKLIADQSAYSKTHNLANKDPYFGDKELKKHVESGKMTNDDLNKIQENLHKTLSARQEQVHGKLSGIHRDQMSEFMNEATNTKQAFDEKGLAIAHVDTDRKEGGNHYILAGQHDGKSFVYDPYSIKGANEDLDQVTQDPEKLKTYRDSMATVNGNKYVYSGNNRPFGT